MARHGYEYENPREARAREKEMRRQMTQMGMVPPPPTSEALGGKGKRETEGDAYEEYYSSEEREQVGWEVVRQMEKEEEKRCEHGLVKAQGTHRNDPYADYAQLKAAGNVEDTEAIIREARRVNREGLVGYGLGEDAVGRETASKFNVPSAGMGQEWSAFEAAAAQGIQDMGRYQDIGGGASSQKGSGSTLEAEEEMGIEEFMARLGYEYADPRVAKSQGEVESRPVDDPTSSSTESSFQSLAAPSTSVGNAFPRPQTIAPPAASPDASPSPFNTIQPLPPRADQSPPPWAHEIEALYDRVRANQAAARRRQGLPPLPGDADVMLPFIHPPGDQPLDPQGRPRQLTTEEVLSKLEMVRVNPDGSFTKVEAGQGVPTVTKLKPSRGGQQGRDTFSLRMAGDPAKEAKEKVDEDLVSRLARWSTEWATGGRDVAVYSGSKLGTSRRHSYHSVSNISDGGSDCCRNHQHPDSMGRHTREGLTWGSEDM
ncbi:hypothetical protein Naga_100028g20 [Nannochloropsis gaditana]|uniref:Uncharacterized protein n=1 Tax=Nannochloropsis gaditana TaxID=72520 RepID=W7U958_9STRA|nr:hypothetical protein Naga_100028g20 [Nannochloropsis gaditana]